MNAKLEQNSGTSPGDIAKTTLAVLLVVGGMVGFYWFSDWPGPLRGALVGVSLAAAAVVFILTERGRALMEFLSESRFELRKVVWPTREETIRTTGLIIVVVIIVSLMLAVIDFFLAGGVRWLLG
jgi:preprotein translocase subunit SecE